ncbi:MAG TPA: ribosome recycling factor [Nitrospirae bacterium]|nr:ribosome-recycling factor [bacterium BMS3Abin10]GBE39861.1 ribosome-recycling factor [bacterium BMS3Bbin08]HDH01157.1 ribosome recycling factor [Nitrospirota bacterium]HDH51414.1 ribosome recycling factor [Nitrospirota bacterium]HDK41449.1 ribosome recycling factor [Nitrospirota bacterium]
MQAEVEKKLKDKMERAMEALKKDLAAVRTGRASLAVFDGLMVDYYGTPTPINQIATMSVPESRLITIQPWDPKIISEIERSIQKSDLGLNPSNDGKIIRIAIPQLTEERRKQIIKHVHKRVEEAKVSIRNIRRDGKDEIKHLEKEEHISEDDTKNSMDELQKLTDSFVKRTDEIMSHKEAELMEI